MATYRSAVEFSLRFGAPPVRAADRFRFPIEDYLFARGDDYVLKYRAESFLVLSESIDLHQMDATQVQTPATLIAVREDQLVPFNDMQALSARLNGPRQLIEINSIFGHDAFLKEGAALTPIIKQALAEQKT
jgi:homoserine O-acetyltransferase